MTKFATKIRRFQRETLDCVVGGNLALGLDRRAEYFVSLFEKWLPRSSEVLDIGGGWGFYAEPMRRRGHRLSILDVVKPGYQKAPVMLYDGTRIPFQDKSFDVSFLITVLHHVNEPESLLQEVQRVTRKTLIVVEDLYHHSLGRWWTVLRDRFFNFEFIGHPCYFKKAQEWKEIFKRLGFSVLGSQEVYTWLAGLRILNGIFVLQLDDKS